MTNSAAKRRSFEPLIERFIAPSRALRGAERQHGVQPGARRGAGARPRRDGAASGDAPADGGRLRARPELFRVSSRGTLLFSPALLAAAKAARRRRALGAGGGVLVAERGPIAEPPERRARGGDAPRRRAHRTLAERRPCEIEEVDSRRLVGAAKRSTRRLLTARLAGSNARTRVSARRRPRRAKRANSRCPSRPCSRRAATRASFLRPQAA